MTKYLLAFASVLLLSTNINAQRYLKSAKVLSHKNDTLTIEVASYFYIYYDICNRIEITGTDANIIGDELFVKLYYYYTLLTSSAEVDCNRKDTVSIPNVPSDIKNAQLSMYVVILYDQNDTTNANSSVITFLPLNIRDNSIADKISISPNPVTEVLTINGIKPNNTIKLYNMLGVEAYSKKSSSTSEQLNIEHLPTGYYMLQLTNEKGKKTVYKVVKQ